ncbi:MAG: bis(5'-nucleosyl)-tetraphosphatase (symmetrical) YqeK [Firmicutes bacterium]|nr:bis(5'-nucleosyl)-tetraphosphatase (symmetrical) YqeK [Bacillota bacterium]
MTPQEAAKRRLSAGRLRHVEGVVQTACDLARRFGANIEKAQTAAWLHDLYREESPATMRVLAGEVGFVLPAGPPKTWHGPLCAALMMREFGIEDTEIRDAVAYHTVGNPTMPLLARVLYVADAIEPGRDYPAVALLRETAQTDLTLALARCADDAIAHLLSQQVDVSLVTVDMRNRAYTEWRSRSVDL